MGDKAELGYITRKENKETITLFPKTLGRGVFYQIDNGYLSDNKQARNFNGSTLSDVVKSVVGENSDGEPNNTHTAKEMMDILLFSMYGMSNLINVTDFEIEAEGDNTTSAIINNIYNIYEQNKAKITFSDALENVQCWYDANHTSELTKNGNSFVIDNATRFEVPTTITYSDGSNVDGNWIYKKTINIYYNYIKDGQELSNVKEVSFIIKFVAPSKVSIALNQQVLTPIGLKCNLSEVDYVPSIQKQDGNLSTISDIKYGFDLSNLTPLSGTTINGLKLQDFLNQNKEQLNGQLKYDSINNIYYIILNDSLINYTLTDSETRPLYITFTKTPKNGVDGSLIAPNNQIIETINLTVKGTINDYYYCMSEYTETPNTPIFYNGQDPQDTIILSEIFKIQQKEQQFDSCWYVNNGTTKPIIEFDVPNSVIDYSKFGGQQTTTEYIYYGFSNTYGMIPTSETEIINGNPNKTFVKPPRTYNGIIESVKINQSLQIEIPEETYRTIWIAIPNNEYSKFEIWKDKNGETKENEVTDFLTCQLNGSLNFDSPNGTPPQIDKYTIYYFSQVSPIPQRWINIIPIIQASDIKNHGQRRLLNLLFRKDETLYDIDKDGNIVVFTRGEGASQFYQIEAKDYIINDNITIKYDDDSTSKFIWLYLKTYQEYKTFIKISN